MKPMPHAAFGLVTWILTACFGMLGMVAFVAAIATNSVAAMVVSVVCYHGMRAMGAATTSEFDALNAHKQGKWCGHRHCGLHTSG